MKRAWRASSAGWVAAAWITAAGCASAPVSAPTPGYDSDMSTGAKDVEAKPEAAEPGQVEEGRAEVEQLAQEIEAAQSRAGNVGVQGGLKAGPPPQEPPGGDQARCALACDVSRGICGSSERICTIAGRLAQETDLAERCAWSQQACEESQTRCTTCSP